MAVTQGPFLAGVLLLVSHGLQCSPPLPGCPAPCLCQRAPLLNCSSSGLSLAPQRIQATATELDLSHNLLNSMTLHRPHHNLRSVWLGNNSITHLSLCIERTMGNQYVRGKHPHRSRPWSRQGCVSWAPALQLLSVERNQLVQLPEGLGGSESLQVLQLSFNRISTLRPGDLSHLGQLKELHLQHNRITSLHSQALRGLSQLRVLDLSFNLLTSVHPLIYLSLRNIGADVRLSGNRWQCDCSMSNLRRWMAYDSNRGQQAWSVECAFPSTLSGRDLLHLEEDDLICFNAQNRPGLHQDVTVDSGSEILLSCSTQQDSTWWTPNGQVSVSQTQAGLLISEITERDAGLYVCVSESEQEIVSVFNLQIRKTGETKRKTRSPRTLRKSSQLIIPQDIPRMMGQGRNQNTTQSDLTLAVCLSVFITFLVAFILGVLVRPFIDVLWRRVCNKKRSSPTHSVSSAGQRPYDNDAYSSGEEPEEIGTHRERRVTFNTVEFRENRNVPYYDTVASGNQENINEAAVIECETVEADHWSSGSDSSLQPEDNQSGGRDLSGVSDPGPTHSMEFEHIPDPSELDERISLSSHSDTSLSDKVQKQEQLTQRDPWTSQSPQLLEDPLQQRSKSPTVRPVEVPQISIDDRSEIPGFSCEPFSDWSPNINSANLTDPNVWQENGEKFEFSDSIGSPSARSSVLFGSFDDSNQTAFLPSDNRKRSDSSSSSSSSCVSGDEPTQYTVNPERGEDEDVEMTQNDLLTNDTKPKIANTCLKQDVTFEQQIQGVDPFKSSLQGEGFNQGDYRHDTQGLSVGPQHFDFSDSSDSDDEPMEYTVQQETDEEKEREEKVSKSDKPASSIVTVERDRTEEVNPMPWTDLQWPDQNKDRMEVGITSREPETQWPDLDLSRITHIKRRLDIKAPSPPLDSPSSSESADETTDRIVKQERGGEMDMAGLPFKESQIVSQEPEIRLPDLDLSRITHIKRPDLGLTSAFHIKRHLDIKAPSPPPESSSSSSESEDGTTDPMVKLERDRNDCGITNHEPESKKPDLSLGVPYISRRLDIKAPSQPDDSYSSCSDNENKMTSHTVKQERDRANVGIISNEPEAKLPDLSLGVPHIKRRLDIKAPPPQPDLVLSRVPPYPSVESHSSSSESEDENRNHTAKLEMEVPVVSMATENEPIRRPKASLISIPPTPKRAHNIKLEKYAKITDELEDKTTAENISPAPKVNPELESRWAGMNLGMSRFKKRLDITLHEDAPPKVPSSPPPESSSSSSESGDESKSSRVRQNKGAGMQGTIYKESSLTSENKPVNVSLSLKNADNINSDSSVEVKERLSKDYSFPATEEKSDPEAMLAGLSVPRIKRYLDIKITEKAPPTPPLQQLRDSSSSSENEDESTGHAGKGWREMPPSMEPESTCRYLSNVPHVKRALDIKAPSLSESSSSSNSEDETVHHTVQMESDSVDMGLTSHERETKLPDLSLGVPRIKRYLNIKAPSPQPHDSSSSSENEDESTGHAGKGWRERSQLPSMEPESTCRYLSNVPHTKRNLDIKALSPSLSESSSSSNSEDETKLPDLSLGVPRVKRYLNIKAPSPQPTDSPSSSSENINEMTGHTAKQNRDGMDLSGITHKSSQIISHKHLGIKAPSPTGDSSSSSSEDDTTDHAKQRKKEAEKLTVTQEDSSRSVGGINAALAPRRDLNINFDDVVRRRIEQARRTPDVDLPSELRWTGVTRHLPNLPIASQRRRLDVGIQPPQEAPPAVPGSPPPNSSSSSSSSSESGDEMKPEREKAEITQLPKYSSLSPVSATLAPSGALDNKFDNSSSSTDGTSEDRRERKGLSALKALSSERQKWDTGHEEIEIEAGFNYHSSEKDVKPLAKLSLPELLLASTSIDERRAGGFPRRRRHVVGGIQPPQEAPPPIPATPPPEEKGAATPTWRSPQSSGRQEWKSMSSYQQRERGMEGFAPSSPSSISQGDEGEMGAAHVGLLGATPYHTARRYQSVSPTSTQKVSFDYEESNMTSPSSSKNFTFHFDSSNMISDV